MMLPWQRRAFTPTSTRSRVHFVVLTDDLQQVEIDPAIDGAPAGAQYVQLDVVARDDREFVDRLRGLLDMGSLVRGTIDRERLARCHALQIRLEQDDRADLVGLQAALALCHALSRASGTVAIVDYLVGAFSDAPTFRALRPDRPFDVREHFVSLFDMKGDLVNTRGLAKFARPDVLVRGMHGQPNAAGMLLDLVAEGFGDGKAWRANHGAVSFSSPAGSLPPVCFVPPPAALKTETWGNEYLEVRDLGEQGPLEDCSRVLAAITAVMNRPRA